MHKSHRVKLSPDERERLRKLTTRGTIRVLTYKRARVLLLADESQSDEPMPDEQIAQSVEFSLATVARVRQRFAEEGLNAALHDRPRSGRPPTFDGRDRAKITALACSKPPQGRARWSLRLLAEKAVELELVDRISHDTVKRVLKKTS